MNKYEDWPTLVSPFYIEKEGVALPIENEVKPTVDDKVIKINLDLTNTNNTKNSMIDTSKMFWTTDINSAYLEFATGIDISYGVASIVLINKTDGSVIQKSFDVNASPFYYKMREEEIIRAGNWIGQIVVTRNDKGLTASAFKFGIKGSLLDSAEPALSEIENYQKFYKQLNDLNNEMTAYLEDATLSESERKEAESIRSTLFAEYELNEEVRKQNEIVRDENEENRVSSFESYNERIINLENNKANRKQEAWITPALLNGYTTDPISPIKYLKDNFGNLVLMGRPITIVSGSTAFYLPNGYKPVVRLSVIVGSNVPASMEILKMVIDIDGSVRFFGTPGVTLSLYNIIPLGI